MAIQIWQAADRKYIKDLTQADMLSLPEEQELIRRICRGREAEEDLTTASPREATFLRSVIREGEQSKQALVSANLRLVVYIAKEYWCSKIPFLDLIQEGCLGLVSAVNHIRIFDGKFSSYAAAYIENTIKVLFAKEKEAVRLSPQVATAVNKILRVAQSVTQSLGHPASPEEIAEEMRIPPDTVRYLQSLSYPSVPLDKPLSEGEEENIDHYFSSEEPSPEELVEKQDLRERLLELLDTLEPLEEIVLKLRFGFIDDEPLSPDETAEELGIPLEEARWTEIKAIRKMRHPSRSLYLRDFLYD